MSLTLLFIEPPPARRVGGIDTALESWSQAMASHGLTVRRHDATRGEPDFSGVDLVHCHGLWEPRHEWWRRQGRRLNLPIIMSPHGMLDPWARRHKRWRKAVYFQMVERPALHLADRVLATSEEERLSLLSLLPRAKIDHLPLGLSHLPAPAYAEARAKLGWHADERVCVFLSRLHPKKGLHVLLEAWQKLAPPPSLRFRLVIVGEGEAGYVQPLQNASRDQSEVEWLGPCWGERKWLYLQGADLFCLPSFGENFGYAVLEAAAVGTPVVTSPATPWASLRGEMPIVLVEPNVEQLTPTLQARLQQLPASPAARDRAHREALQRFAWSALAPRYVSFYQSVLTPV
jgi:glycosyltransferase involved in cell wall biosynthesis